MTIRDQVALMAEDENGATAIEYALIAATMAAAMIPALGYATSGVALLYSSIVALFARDDVAI